MLSRSVIVEREVSIVDFKELKYMGRSIGYIMDDQGWIGYLNCTAGRELILERPIGAYPTVEMANKPDVEDIFCTFTGQNVVLVGSFTRQKFMLPFWRILQLIFAYTLSEGSHDRVPYYEMLAMDHSEKSITNAGAQTEQLAWVEELVVELNAIRIEVVAMRDHVSQLYQSLHTVPIQIQILIKRMDIMEE
ncbi:hypothetical protein CJ030_MR4G026707 [Morella rubra]|uniref:Uncharacterized protein n=1 Tax=Morella rubra TaxID=262757 RepID=A0A6A1VTP1_9ROSI|nr:hypothetical protein CJ030_MR4G026707 [Morella rubra]